MRGILAVCMLVELERTTGQLTRDIFSFVGGTSTGAVIAAAVAAGVPASQLLNLYLSRTREVFARPPWPLFLIKRFFWGHMYSSQTLRRVISEEAGDARNWRIQDSPIDILITAKRIDDGMPWYFVKDQPGNTGRTGKLSLMDCVTASAVAPTFFAPWTVPEPDPPAGERPVGALTDGAVGVAGNPCYQTCVEAFEYTADKYLPAETTLVSLGTGRQPAQTKPTWLPSWITWLLGELLDSAGEQQTELVRRHYPETPFYRLDPALPTAFGPDAIGDIPRLHEIGRRFAQSIDWRGILDGEKPDFLVADNTLPHQYQKGV